MYTLTDGKTRFTYNYKTVHSLMLSDKKFYPPITMNANTEGNLQNIKNKSSITSKYYMYNNKNQQDSWFSKKHNISKDRLIERIQRHKVDLLYKSAYDKLNNRIRHYDDDNNSNNCTAKRPNKSFKLPLLTKEKVKDEIITKTNKYFPKKYSPVDNHLSRDRTWKDNYYYNINKNTDYRNIYFIKYITQKKKDSKKEDKKDIDKRGLYLDLQITKPL